MSWARLLLGRWGEGKAARFLRRRGYRILERNYRCAAGEADLIARDGSVVAFVEVKTRSPDPLAAPELAVDRKKRGRLARVAAHYLLTHPEFAGAACRFDVVALVRGGGEEPRLIRDAFRLDL